MTYKIERVVTQQPHLQYVTTEVTYNAIEQDTILDPLDVDTWVKLYRGFKYDYITCVRSTAPEVTVANEQAIQDLLILIEGMDETNTGSGLVEVQDEGSQVGIVSSLNFAGMGVEATLDPDDQTGKTALITIASGGQNIHKSIIEDPEIVYDNDYGAWVAKAELTGQITDVTIVISSSYDGGNNGGEGGEYTETSVLVIDMPVDEYAEGDIIRITLQLGAPFGKVVVRSVALLLVPTVLIGSSDIIQRNMHTLWTYQKRDGVLELLSVSSSGIPPEGSIIDPFIRFDQPNNLPEEYQIRARNNIQAASVEEVYQRATPYSNVIAVNHTPYTVSESLFQTNGRAIVRLEISGSPQVVNLPFMDISNYPYAAGAEITFIKNGFTPAIGYTHAVINGPNDEIYYLRNHEDSITFKYTEDVYSTMYGRWMPVASNVAHYAVGLQHSNGGISLQMDDFINALDGELCIETLGSGVNEINIERLNLSTLKRGASFIVINSGGGTVRVIAGANTHLNGVLSNTVEFNGPYRSKLFIKISPMAEPVDRWVAVDLSSAGGSGTEIQSIVVACSDETTALTTGVGKVTFRMPYAFTVSAVRASLTTAQASGTIFTVDINESGTTILSTKLTIDNTEKTSTTADTAPVISDTALADDAEITIDIDQIGDGTAKGLKITLIGTRA